MLTPVLPALSAQLKFSWSLGDYWANQEYTFEAFATTRAGDGPTSASAGSLTTAAYPPNAVSATISSVGPYDAEQALPYGHDSWTVLFQGGGGTASIVSLASQVTAGPSPSVSDAITTSAPAGITGALRVDSAAGLD